MANFRDLLEKNTIFNEHPVCNSEGVAIDSYFKACHIFIYLSCLNKFVVLNIFSCLYAIEKQILRHI